MSILLLVFHLTFGATLPAAQVDPTPIDLDLAPPLASPVLKSCINLFCDVRCEGFHDGCIAGCVGGDGVGPPTPGCQERCCQQADLCLQQCCARSI